MTVYDLLSPPPTPVLAAVLEVAAARACSLCRQAQRLSGRCWHPPPNPCLEKTAATSIMVGGWMQLNNTLRRKHPQNCI